MTELWFDISKWQGSPDFDFYRDAGAVGIIHKAGGSDDGRYTDSRYVGNAPRVRQAGLRLGSYWFNGEGDPINDANYYVDNLQSFRPGDMLILDVEGENQMSFWDPDRAMAFLTTVESRTGQKPYIYMSESVTKEADWRDVANAYPDSLWVAKYSSNHPVIGFWSHYVGWQFTDNYPGVGVDASYFDPQSETPLAAKPVYGEQDMIHYYAYTDSTDGMIATGQRFVQGAEGPLRCLSDSEWGPISIMPGIMPAQWRGDDLTALISIVGLLEYTPDSGATSHVGRLTGRVIYSTTESREYPITRPAPTV